jgi:hypothetical protein
MEEGREDTRTAEGLYDGPSAADHDRLLWELRERGTVGGRPVGEWHQEVTRDEMRVRVTFADHENPREALYAFPTIAFAIAARARARTDAEVAAQIEENHQRLLESEDGCIRAFRDEDIARMLSEDYETWDL